MNKIRGFEIITDQYRKHPEVDIKLPQREEPGSCGYDVYSPVAATINPGESLLIWTDVKAYMQLWEALDANTRSGNGTRGIIIKNIIGWIDSTYYSNPKNDGNIGICLENRSNEPFNIEIGDKIAQLRFMIYLTADDDNPRNEKRVGGFGSSGIK